MNVQQKQNQKGFTIIEVVLVLAIAGLIFLMVFIALPALQRSQRDGQRRSDVSKFVSQLTSYSTNNRGSLPTAANVDSFMTSYMKTGTGEFKDPKTGEAYKLSGNSGADDPQVGEIQYVPSKPCNGENVDTGAANNLRQAAVRVQLEGSGFFCQSAQ